MTPDINAIKYWPLTIAGLIGPAGLALPLLAAPHKQLGNDPSAWVLLMACSVVLVLRSYAFPLAFWRLRGQRNRGFVLFFLLCVGWSGASLLILTEFRPQPSEAVTALFVGFVSMAAATFGLCGRWLANRAVR